MFLANVFCLEIEAKITSAADFSASEDLSFTENLSCRLWLILFLRPTVKSLQREKISICYKTVFGWASQLRGVDPRDWGRNPQILSRGRGGWRGVVVLVDGS